MDKFTKSKVKRIFVHSDGTSIRLKDKGAGYFNLSSDHPQYDALYSLALVAAVNRYNLMIRTDKPREEITDQESKIRYLVIDW